MSILLPVITFGVLLPGLRKRCGRERILYLILSLLASGAGLAAGFFAKTDHVGASLSGMVSIFMR